MQSRVVILAGLVLACASGAFAQGAAPADSTQRVLKVGKWYPHLESGLNLTQSAYSENWKGGDTGSVSWSAYMNGLAERQISSSLNWLNTMHLKYGQTRDQKVDANGHRSWGASEPSTDQVDVESLFRLTRGWPVDPYFSARFETLFQDVSDPFGRKIWFNPLTLKESAGVARKLIDRKDHQMLARFGVTAREMERSFFTATTGDQTTSESSWDSGTELVVDYRRDFNPQLSYTSRFSAYKPFHWSKKNVFDSLSPDSLAAAGLDRNVASYTTSTDVDWQNTISAKVAKLIAVQLYVEFLYDQYDNTIVPVVDESGSLTNPQVVDYAVRKKGQYKQTLGIGLTWTF
jgi:hypothetical protein